MNELALARPSLLNSSFPSVHVFKLASSFCFCCRYCALTVGYLKPPASSPIYLLVQSTEHSNRSSSA